MNERATVMIEERDLRSDQPKVTETMTNRMNSKTERSPMEVLQQKSIELLSLSDPRRSYLLLLLLPLRVSWDEAILVDPCEKWYEISSMEGQMTTHPLLSTVSKVIVSIRRHR